MAVRHVIQYSAGDGLWDDGPGHEGHAVAKLALKQARAAIPYTENSEGVETSQRVRLVTMETEDD